MYCSSGTEVRCSSMVGRERFHRLLESFCKKPALHPKHFIFLIALLSTPLLLIAVFGQAQEVDRLQVSIIGVFPHDTEAFTQGLHYCRKDEKDLFYESTGLYGESTVREVDMVTGEVLRKLDLTQDQFGEGLVLVDDTIYQLTWKKGVLHVYDRVAFEKTGEIHYVGEGWGLCYDGEHFIQSDGSSRLYVRSLDTFNLIKTIQVTLYGQPLRDLNELEYVNGYIYANIWKQDTIAKIQPQSGNVVALIDASRLLIAEEKNNAGVLNGIAFNPYNGHFFITGKKWPNIFEVEFTPPKY